MTILEQKITFQNIKEMEKTFPYQNYFNLLFLFPKIFNKTVQFKRDKI